jgi:hypothetical protein
MAHVHRLRFLGFSLTIVSFVAAVASLTGALLAIYLIPSASTVEVDKFWNQAAFEAEVSSAKHLWIVPAIMLVVPIYALAITIMKRRVVWPGCAQKPQGVMLIVWLMSGATLLMAALFVTRVFEAADAADAIERWRALTKLVGSGNGLANTSALLGFWLLTMSCWQTKPETPPDTQING